MTDGLNDIERARRKREDAGPWKALRATCKACGHQRIAIMPSGTDEATLECSRCGARDSTTEPIV